MEMRSKLLIFKETEIKIKYFLAIICILMGFISWILMILAPRLWDDLMEFFFIPYLTLVIALVPCWDILNEKRIVHKIVAIIFILIIIIIFYMAYINIGFPGQDTFHRWWNHPVLYEQT